MSGYVLQEFLRNICLVLFASHTINSLPVNKSTLRFPSATLQRPGGRAGDGEGAGGTDRLIDWPSRLTSGTTLPYEPMDSSDFLSTRTICEISLR